ncbi:MAG: sugar phosphate nucleotidyltransferase [Candidatus Hodarchaeales archaeon]
MKAFVLCAGKGTRLLPLTETTPKPLLPLLDRSFFDHVVDSLTKAGITGIGVIIGYLKQEFTKRYSESDYTFIEQEKLSGMGGAVLEIEGHVEGNEPFIVAAGDNLFPPAHVKSIMQAIIKPEIDAVVSLIELSPSEIINKMATVKLGKNNKVLEIKEKPSTIEEIYSPFATTAIFAFNSSIFQALKENKVSSRGELEIQQAIQAIISKDGNVVGIPLSNRDFIQITSVPDLYHLNLQFLRRSGRKNVIHPTVIVGKNTVITNSVIGKNCYINSGITVDRTIALEGANIMKTVSDSLCYQDSRPGNKTAIIPITLSKNRK